MALSKLTDNREHLIELTEYIKY